MMTKSILLFLVVFLVGCVSHPSVTTEPGVVPELSLSVPTQCKERPDSYTVLKNPGNPCLFIDGREICNIKFRSFKATTERKLTLQPGDLSRFANFQETKRKETFTSGKDAFQRDSCELMFDVELKGKIQRCSYNRLLKDVDIICP